MRYLVASAVLHGLVAWLLLGGPPVWPGVPEPPAQVALVFASRTTEAAPASIGARPVPVVPAPAAMPLPAPVVPATPGPRPALVVGRGAMPAPAEVESVLAAMPSGFAILNPDNAVVARPAPGNRPPPFPEGAVARHEHGTVSLRIHVAPDGAVARVETLRGSGFADLDAAARDSVLRWRFIAGRRDGVAVPSACDLSFAFVME